MLSQRQKTAAQSLRNFLRDRRQLIEIENRNFFAELHRDPAPRPDLESAIRENQLQRLELTLLESGSTLLRAVRNDTGPAELRRLEYRDFMDPMGWVKPSCRSFAESSTTWTRGGDGSRTAAGNTIGGLAAVYDKPSLDLGGFIEHLKPGCFDAILARRGLDTCLLMNHNPDHLLARAGSSLKLWSDKRGLAFAAELPFTALGKSVLESIRRHDLRGCSFAFIVERDSWKMGRAGAPDIREILEVAELFDVGPVTYPAYPDTSVAAS